MKTNNKTTIRIRAMRAGLLATAAGMLLLSGCAGGGGAGTASTAPWPSATPPATTQTNTYVGTQSPGLYTVTIDHTNNTFSYQDLSTTSSAAVSGTFTAAANGFLVLSTSTGATGYALEQLSRAVMLVPPLQYKNGVGSPVLLTSAPIFAIAALSCQIIPDKTEFTYLATANPNYEFNSSSSEEITEEREISSGMVYASTDASGANWQFGGELQYFPAGSSPLEFTPEPDPYSGTCAANTQNVAVIQTALTTPSSLAANTVIGPTGYFVEDRYQSDGLAFAGSVIPSSPVDLSQLKGATFLGVEAGGGAGSLNTDPAITAPELVSFTAAPDSSGTSIELTGGAFPNNNLAQPPATNSTFDLGAQDPNNNGYFPAVNGTVYAVVTNAGGKYSIFVVAAGGGWILFQQ